MPARAPRALALGFGVAASVAASVAAVGCAGNFPEGNADPSDASTDGADAAEVYFDGGTIVAMYGSPGCDVADAMPVEAAPVSAGAVLGAAMILAARRRKKRD